MKTIQPRIKNPAMLIPDVMQPLMAFVAAVRKSAVSQRTLDLVHLRASQINGCSVCVDMGSRELKNDGESDERLFAVAAWRESPYFTDGERAALALTESLTRLADRSEAVPDDIWEGAVKHFDETELATLLLAIATINVWNRLNAAVRQPVGAWKV